MLNCFQRIERVSARTCPLLSKIEFWVKLRVRLGACKTGLSPPVKCVTDRSKAIILWWFFLFYVLVFNFFCAVGALCVFS